MQYSTTSGLEKKFFLALIHSMHNVSEIFPSSPLNQSLSAPSYAHTCTQLLENINLQIFW